MQIGRPAEPGARVAQVSPVVGLIQPQLTAPPEGVRGRHEGVVRRAHQEVDVRRVVNLAGCQVPAILLVDAVCTQVGVVGANQNPAGRCLTSDAGEVLDRLGVEVADELVEVHRLTLGQRIAQNL